MPERFFSKSRKGGGGEAEGGGGEEADAFNSKTLGEPTDNTTTASWSGVEGVGSAGKLEGGGERGGVGFKYVPFGAGPRICLGAQVVSVCVCVCWCGCVCVRACVCVRVCESLLTHRHMYITAGDGGACTRSGSDRAWLRLSHYQSCVCTHINRTHTHVCTCILSPASALSLSLTHTRVYTYVHAHYQSCVCTHIHRTHTLCI